MEEQSFELRVSSFEPTRNSWLEARSQAHQILIIELVIRFLTRQYGNF